VNRRQGWVALIVLGLALAGPGFLHASKTSTHAETPKQQQKLAKSYNKQLKKQQKQQAKLQKKQEKQFKKEHPTAGHVTTTRKVT
jgi:uncharacterized protein HemX